jgi:hypothetical protein
MSLALVLISARSIAVASFWNISFSGVRWQAQGWGSRKSFYAAPLEYCPLPPMIRKHGEELGKQLWGPQRRKQLGA